MQRKTVEGSGSQARDNTVHIAAMEARTSSSEQNEPDAGAEWSSVVPYSRSALSLCPPRAADPTLIAKGPLGASEAVYTLKRSLIGFALFVGLLPFLVVLCSLIVASPGGPDDALLFLIPFGYLSIVSLRIFWLSTLCISLGIQGLLSSQSLKMPQFIRWEEVWLVSRY